MVVFIGLSSSGPHPAVHQPLELVVITTTDDFELKSVSPSYVLYRAPGGPIGEQEYCQHQANNLLTESSLSHRKPIHVEDLLLEQFGRHNQTLYKSTTVYDSASTHEMLKLHFPNFYKTLGGPVVFYNEYADQAVVGRCKHSGRALEDLLTVISETKRIRPW